MIQTKTQKINEKKIRSFQLSGWNIREKYKQNSKNSWLMNGVKKYYENEMKLKERYRTKHLKIKNNIFYRRTEQIIICR